MSEPNILPTEQEISQLPRWARVAFAARCARRVLPLFRHILPDGPSEHLSSMEQTVAAAEHVAAAALTAPKFQVPRLVAERAIADTARVTFEILASAQRSSDWVHAATSAQALSRADFDRLLLLAREERWTDDTPVPPEVFGPLWPNELAASVPVVLAVTERLNSKMRKFAPTAKLLWRFTEEPFPAGLWATIAVPDWDLDGSTKVLWNEFEDPRAVASSLLILWSSVLGRRSEQLRAEGMAAVGAE